jgi:hypothetical protein
MSTACGHQSPVIYVRHEELKDHKPPCQFLLDRMIVYSWIARTIPPGLVHNQLMRWPHSLSPESFEHIWDHHPQLAVVQILARESTNTLLTRFQQSSQIEWSYCAALAIHYLMAAVGDDTVTGLFQRTVCVGFVDETALRPDDEYVDALLWLDANWNLVRRLSSPNFPLKCLRPITCTDEKHWTQCLEYVIQEQTGLCWQGVRVTPGVVADAFVDTSELTPLSFWRHLSIDIGEYCHWYHHKIGSVRYPDDKLGLLVCCGACSGARPVEETLCVRQGGVWVCGHCRQLSEPLDMPPDMMTL